MQVLEWVGVIQYGCLLLLLLVLYGRNALNECGCKGLSECECSALSECKILSECGKVLIDY